MLPTREEPTCYLAREMDMATCYNKEPRNITYSRIMQKKTFGWSYAKERKTQLITVPCKTTGVDDPLENDITAAPEYKI